MLGDSLIEWGDWDILLPEYNSINRGVAGEDVEGLSARLADETMAAGKAEYILIMAGTNNLLMGSLFFPAIFTTMLVRLQQFCPESIITVNAILPMNIPDLNRKTIDHVNQELEAITQKAGCRFLDMDAAFTAHCLPITKPCFFDDGVHLSTRGYQVWAQKINNHLQHLKGSDQP